MDRIVTYNLTDDFIQCLADFTDKNFLKKAKDISRTAFVFGGKRPGLFLKKELSARIKNGFFPPSFFSIDEFAQYILSKDRPYVEISSLDACYIIYNLAKEQAPGMLKERESFSKFLPWAREILGFIDHLDLEDIEDKPLENIQFKAQLGYDVPENINILLKGIISLRAAYHEALKAKNMYSRGLGYLTASKRVTDVDLSEFDYIFFAGFFYLHKTELTVIKKLYERQKAVLFFQGSDEDWGVLKDLSARFSHPIRPERPVKPSYNLSIQAGFDLHSEACLAREALKNIKDRSKTVIVLPDEGSMVPLLSEISSYTNDFNVSMGYPLNRSSAYSLFEAIFKAQETKKPDEYYAKDYLKALSHPLVKNLKAFENPPLTRVLIHKIEETLLGIIKNPLAGALFVKLDDIQDSSYLYEAFLTAINNMGEAASWDDARAAVLELHRFLFRLWEPIANFYDFAFALKEFLDILVKKSFLNNAANKYPLNLKMAEEIFNIKEEITDSFFNKEPFASREIFKVFKNRLDNVKISFKGSPLKGLQILGLLETRSLNFRDVIIMDVNESVLPSLKIYEPLIPRDVMISLGLNRLEKEEEIQRYQFSRLIASAKNVSLIYKQTDKHEKSRFIEELTWGVQKKNKSLDTPQAPKASFEVSVMPKKIRIEKSDEAVKFLRNMEYSASGINTYLNCPLNFYYSYCLGLEQKEDLLGEPEAADIGTFIHELLEEAFARFVNRRPRIDAKFRDYFKSVLDRKFSEEFLKRMKSDSFLIKEVLDFRMDKFLDNEAQRDVEEVLCLEKNFKANIKLSGEDFKFQAYIDRIDRLSDNSLLVLDYKTGSVGNLPSVNIPKIEAAGFSREALKKTIKSFQLPLYLYFVDNDARFKAAYTNAALYSVKDASDNQGINKLFKDEEGLNAKGEVMAIYIKALEAIVREILDQKTAFEADDSNPRNCANCQFLCMCR